MFGQLDKIVAIFDKIHVGKSSMEPFGEWNYDISSPWPKKPRLSR